jgi:glycosyltransferase involved in cell wall biosynthesis
MEEYIIDQQVESVTAEIEDSLAAKKFPEALSILKSSWSFFRNQLNQKRGILVGEVLIRNGYFEEATGLMEHLVLLHPRDPNALRWWVQAYAETLNVEHIIPRAEIAVCNPNVAISTFEHLCDALVKIGQINRAKEILLRNRKRLQLRGHRLMMHILFYHEMDYRGVANYLSKVPETISGRSEFATHWALAFFEIGRIEDAHETLSPLVSKGCINAGFTKYELHRAAGDTTDALEVLNEIFSYHGMTGFERKWADSGFQLDSILPKPSPPSSDERMVSVIMTAHKMNPMMDAAVSSILNQTHQHLELLIIDDASPPADVEHYKHYAKMDKRVRIIRQDVNSGTYAGRNRGITEAAGEFISFADSDDWQHPQKFELALKRLDANPEAVATLESYIRLDPQGRLAKIGSWFARKCLMGITWKNTVLKDELGGFDEVRVSADSELLERAEVRYGKAALVHKPLPMYMATYHDQSLTGGGPFAIGWRGIRGPRGEYVASFRAWHSKLRASPSGLSLTRRGEKGYFRTPAEMPRANAGMDYMPFEDSEMFPILDDLSKFKKIEFQAGNGNSPQKNESVTICMATFPGRFSVIGKAVESLLNQSIQPTKILIHVNESDRAPPLPDDSRIEVHCSPDENLTDIGKFKMASLVSEGYILTVDDDIIYPHDYVESHLSWLNAYENKVITGFHGAVLPVGEPINTWQEYKEKRRVHWFKRGLSLPLPVQIVGTGTMGYHVDHVKFDHTQFYNHRMVDLFIAVHAQINGIPMITPPRKDDWMRTIDEEEEDLQAIWSQVQVNFDLQNKMMQVIRSVGSWRLITPKQIFDSKTLHSPLKLNFKREAMDNKKHVPYDVRSCWRQDGNTLFFMGAETNVFFEMPAGWKLEETHEDLFRTAHYVLTSPWEDGILDDWIPSRQPGWRPGLAFSGGIDSVASMLLMPQDTVLVYNRRKGFKSALDHTNADRLFDYLLEATGRPVIQVASNHEIIRKKYGKSVGFSTDYACAVQVILLADYLQLDSIATGMPLENTYLFHGHRYRNFGSSWFWRHHSEIFKNIGLSIYQPVSGCSEVINQRIVMENGLLEFAQSCLRSDKPGVSCGACWKCFRKNSLAGHDFTFSNEIETFLHQRPLKQAASTLYSIQKLENDPSYEEIISKSNDFNSLLLRDFKFLESHHEAALKLLPPKYRRFTANRVSKYCHAMTSEQFKILSSMDLFPHTQ